MTAAVLRAVWSEGERHVRLRSCAYCANRALPVVVATMPNYGGGVSRYSFCSELCRRKSTALRRLGLTHDAEQFDPPCRAALRRQRRHSGQAGGWEGRLAAA